MQRLPGHPTDDAADGNGLVRRAVDAVFAPATTMASPPALVEHEDTPPGFRALLPP